MRNALELVEVDSDRLEEVLRRAERLLDEKDAALIRAVFESYAYVTELVEDKNTSIRRLRQLFFGTRTEKTAAVVGEKVEDSDAPSERAAAAKTGLDAEVQNPAESSESGEAAALERDDDQVGEETVTAIDPVRPADDPGPLGAVDRVELALGVMLDEHVACIPSSR